MTLLETIKNRTAKIVVIGMGYVGLSVACLLAEAGLRVVGIVLDQDRADMINHGKCPIGGEEPDLAELLDRAVLAGRLQATTDYSVCSDAQVVLIAVDTPVDKLSHRPIYESLQNALTNLGYHLTPNTLIIIESTIAPGTMNRIVQPVLEKTSGLQINQDFYLVHCPERVTPGKLLQNIRTMHRVVGGTNTLAAQLAIALYHHIVRADLDPADCLTAELVKTMENTYRDVQIAFSNEMALLCEDLGADIWQIRQLVNKSPYRNMHLPGAGVGGHCIPKDPWLLIANATSDFTSRLIPVVRAINDGMPLHMVTLTLKALRKAGIEPSDARLAVLGYAYRENSDDTRNSPSDLLIVRLRQLGAEITIHDPYVAQYQDDLENVIQDCHAMILMVAHDAYRTLDLKKLQPKLRRPILIDGRGLFSIEQAQQAGWKIYTLGRGQQ